MVRYGITLDVTVLFEMSRISSTVQVGAPFPDREADFKSSAANLL